mmetsp:Transcript_35392/g.88291  ORF Transcript_35392/g.88291 Transcript_35392/m.88291 type:complete len:253 (+) Transcript_35392:450-1208(+)
MMDVEASTRSGGCCGSGPGASLSAASAARGSTATCEMAGTCRLTCLPRCAACTRIAASSAPSPALPALVVAMSAISGSGSLPAPADLASAARGSVPKAASPDPVQSAAVRSVTPRSVSASALSGSTCAAAGAKSGSAKGPAGEAGASEAARARGPEAGAGVAPTTQLVGVSGSAAQSGGPAQSGSAGAKRRRRSAGMAAPPSAPLERAVPTCRRCRVGLSRRGSSGRGGDEPCAGARLPTFEVPKVARSAAA